MDMALPKQRDRAATGQANGKTGQRKHNAEQALSSSPCLFVSLSCSFLLCLASGPATAQPAALRTTVAGEVVTADSHKAAAGAIITLRREAAEGEPVGYWGQTVTAGQDGKFALEEVEEGTYQVTIAFSQYAPVFERLVVSGSKPVERSFRLQPLGSVFGTILGRDGRPLANASYSFGLFVADAIGFREFRGMYSNAGPGTTDRNGGFRLPGVLPGSSAVVVYVMNEGYATTEITMPQVGDLKGLTLRLLAGEELTGTVKDRESGKPVANATVYLTLYATGQVRFRAFRLPIILRSDQNGSFHATNLPQGRYAAQATADGYAPAPMTPVDLLTKRRFALQPPTLWLEKQR